MGLAEQIRQVRGWPLHAKIAEHALPQLEAGHHDDAVLAAFKVVEERLRELTGKPGATGQALVDAAFHPQTGLLIEPLALPAALEGQFLLFKGAFLVFRNPQAHGFVGLTHAEAVDLILFANRMVHIANEADQRRRSRSTAGTASEATRQRSDYGDLEPYSIDADGDGEREVVIPEFDRGAPIKVYDIEEGRGTRVEVVAIADEQFYEALDRVALRDVDNDGLNEVICSVSWAAGGGFIVYKYRNGHFEPLVPEDVSESYPPVFADAHIVDADGDGNLEIVSQPWDAIPADLIPADYDRGLFNDEHPWGRVRYIYRWNRVKDAFELLSREFLYIGGR